MYRPTFESELPQTSNLAFYTFQTNQYFNKTNNYSGICLFVYTYIGKSGIIPFNCCLLFSDQFSGLNTIPNLRNFLVTCRPPIKYKCTVIFVLCVPNFFIIKTYQVKKKILHLLLLWEKYNKIIANESPHYNVPSTKRASYQLERRATGSLAERTDSREHGAGQTRNLISGILFD